MGRSNSSDRDHAARLSEIRNRSRGREMPAWTPPPTFSANHDYSLFEDDFPEAQRPLPMHTPLPPVTPRAVPRDSAMNRDDDYGMGISRSIGGAPNSAGNFERPTYGSVHEERSEFDIDFDYEPHEDFLTASLTRGEESY